jgi:hypothetical protein
MRVLIGPVSEIVLINKAIELEMGLVWALSDIHTLFMKSASLTNLPNSA